MKCTFKRILSALLVLAMLAAVLPAGLVSAAEPAVPQPEEGEAILLSQADYDQADDIFAQIAAMEAQPAKKNSAQSELTDAAAAIVMASNSYVEGSLDRNGDSFTWETEVGIKCVYSPRMRQIHSQMETPAEPLADGSYNEPVATKGGWPSGNQVYLVGPYYGYDSDFTDQYKNEAKAIATAIGDTDGYTLYSGKAATVDTVAQAVSNGAVVIFDSHGMTDYESGYDYVTGATSSYLCLTSTTGLTSEDYNDGALYYSDGICINGATIANHMTSNSPGGIIWMAICLGMATNTMCDPLRAKGVEVVCGYSQSVTFAGDYLFEETFWDEMCAGSTVAAASAAMKSKWGEWDWSTEIARYYGYSDGYATIADARADYAAFLIIVSDEDTHPGQRNRNTFYGADSLQTVQSTYTLFTQYDVKAQVNNSVWGSATANGGTITATPAAGYFAQGYTVISGNATVTQNGNTFTVSAQSDCVVQINFAAKTVVSVNFSGANVASQSGYAGDSMALPTVTAPEGYTFLGWMDAPLTDNTTEKPAYYDGSFVPNGNTTLYALYSFVDENSGSGTGNYVKVTSSRDDWSGEYLIVYETGGMILNSSLSTMDTKNNYQSVTITNGTISAAAGDPYKFTIEAVSGGYSIKGTSGIYIGCATNANLLTTSTAALKNSISLDASGNANIVGSGGAYLRYNTSDKRFRYYKSSTYTNQKAVALYVKDGSVGTTWYTGLTVVCQHPAPQTVAAVAPGCTEGGYTEGLYCADCDSYISGHEPVAALGHSYTTQVIAPTATQQGYTIYTCSNCGDSYSSDFVEALGETYTVSFVVPSGVAAVESMLCGKAGVTLPAAGSPEGEYCYAFLGWTTGRVDNATQRPEIYTGAYKATEDTTLYAVYSYAVGGTGKAEYVLTDLADIKPTDKVVITMDYQGTVYAMNNDNGTGAAPGDVIISVITENGVKKLASEPNGSLLWNIGGTAGAYVIYPDGVTNKWVFCKTTNNGVRVGTEANKTFSIVDNYLYNNETGRYIGVYRTNPDWRCYTSINDNIKDQTLGFYVLTQVGTTYYTTEFAPACEHESVSYSFADSTHVFTCDDCGEVAFTKTATDGKQFKFNTCAPVLSVDIAMNIAVTVPADFEEPYMVIKFNGVTTTLTDYNINAENGRYEFTFSGINPQTMGDTFDAILYTSVDGYQISINLEYSMLKYINSQLKKEISPELRTALSDLVMYGEANQVYEGYKTNALLSTLLESAATLTPSTFAGLDDSYNKQVTSGDKDANIDLKGITMALGAKVVVRLTIYCTDPSAYSVKVNLNGEDTIIPVSELSLADGYTDRYIVAFDQIRSTQFGETITFSFLDADGNQVGRSMTYTVYTYVYKNQTADGALGDLLQALFNYGESVKAI